MDSFEVKACNMLQRLREIRAQHCCPHIDRQIDLWVENQLGHSQKQQLKHQQHQQKHNHHNLLEQPPLLSPHTTNLPYQQHHRHFETNDEKQSSDERTIGCFLANLKHLESFDSDATESTSSNDSYDELEGFSHEEIPPKKNLSTTFKSHYPNNATLSNQQQHHRASTSSLPSSNHHNNTTSNQRRSSHIQSSDMPSSSNAIALSDNFANMANLKKKSIWKWAKDRSRLASKWTWLQAQIADLEFRVRGQNDALMQARLRKIPPIQPTLPESSCSRTVPLSKDFRNRCLIKSTQILSDSSKSSVKFSQVPCVCISLPQTVAPCLSCKGRYNYLKQSEGENAPLQERASQLDPGCHPVLSLPDDITLGSQISYLLKRETINRKPAKGKPGRKKGSIAAASVASTTDDKTGVKHVNKKGKYNYPGMSNRASNLAQGGHLKTASSTMIASNKLKRKYRKHSTNNQNNYDPAWPRANNIHAHDNNNNSNSTKRNKRIRSASSMNESSLHSDSSNPYRPNHFNNGNSTVRTVTRRRRSEQSAYDINNIVIPFSVAATTRVEILEYKEIMTPSWRVFDNNGTCEEKTDNNVETNNKKEEDEVEDTSDEAYISRHTKGEFEEKKRFSLKPPPKNEISQDSIPIDK